MPPHEAPRAVPPPLLGDHRAAQPHEDIDMANLSPEAGAIDDGDDDFLLDQEQLEAEEPVDAGAASGLVPRPGGDPTASEADLQKLFSVTRRGPYRMCEYWLLVRHFFDPIDSRDADFEDAMAPGKDRPIFRKVSQPICVLFIIAHCLGAI